ncbi:sugar ABC transporter permease [Lachnospiraceae bacterium ZAX-1]
MRKKSVSYAKYGYIFCIPFGLAFLIFSLYPIFYTGAISISDFKGVNARTFQILKEPLDNFIYVLGNKSFRRALGNTAILWLVNFIPQILLAMLLTVWFTNVQTKVRAQGTFKILLYMPNIITAATVAMLFGQLFAYPQGPINSIFLMLGMEKVEFLRSPTVARGIVAFIQFWMWYGSTMIVLIAGVLGISPSLFEAAAVDGANGFQTFFSVTLPGLRTILLYTLITSMIGGLQMFDIPQLFLLGGPDHATETVSVYIYNQAFMGGRQYNVAAAASMIMFAVTAILSGVLFYIMRDRDASKFKKEQRARKKLMKGASI